MKTYTLTIIVNEITGELESLEEKIDYDERPVAINASEEVMEKIHKAGLIEPLLMALPGECVGET
jgi:hypothetical protein|tara:strand:+ start:155 stop:349 length:195 start_codon:yes stop_codon:yes gene_type:complete